MTHPFISRFTSHFVRLACIAGLLVFTSLIKDSQAQEFASLGSTWHYTHFSDWSGPFEAQYSRLKSVKDTLIKGVKMHKVEWLFFSQFLDTIRLRPFFLGQVADTAYRFDAYEDRLNRLYVFNVSKGDTVVLDDPYAYKETFTLVIDSVRQFSQTSKSLKEYFGRRVDDDDYEDVTLHYIDRVGSTGWILPRVPGPIDMPGGPLRCYADEDMELKFREIDCDYLIVSTPDADHRDEKPSVFPNPTSGLFQVQLKEPLRMMRMYSSQGVLVQEALQGGQMDISRLDKGIYYLVITLQSGSTQRHKVIKY